MEPRQARGVCLGLLGGRQGLAGPPGRRPGASDGRLEGEEAEHDRERPTRTHPWIVPPGLVYANSSSGLSPLGVCRAAALPSAGRLSPVERRGLQPGTGHQGGEDRQHHQDGEEAHVDDPGVVGHGGQHDARTAPRVEGEREVERPPVELAHPARAEVMLNPLTPTANARNQVNSRGSK